MTPVEYMISRSLPLLLTQDLSTSKHAVRETTLDLTESDEKVDSIILPIYQVLHGLRLVDVARLQLLPLCDYDLPFRMQFIRSHASIDSRGLLDISSTISTGMHTRGRGVFFQKQIAFDSPDAFYIAVVLQDVLRFADNAIQAISAPLSKKKALRIADLNPTIRGISDRLIAHTSQLRSEIKRRFQLQAIVSNYRIRSPGCVNQLLSKIRARSALAASKLHEYLRFGASITSSGDSFTVDVTNVESKLYEFWCFCEMTRRLRERREFDIIQRSFLRVGMDKPAFFFGTGNYVYYEHRTDYFATPGHSKKFFGSKMNPKRGPEWVVYFGDPTIGPAIIDCKYYNKHSSGMFDCIADYCLEYRASFGIGFSPEAKRKRGIGNDPSNYIQAQRYGNANITRINLCFRPDPACEVVNQQIVDWLIDTLGLVSRRI